MSTTTFHEELKELRTQQKIELSEISNRTKINIKFLEAIESGDFLFLPHVYVRLFLRAYVVEIGADPVDALNQYELFLSNSGEKLPERLEIDTKELLEIPLVEQDDEDELLQKTPFQSRTDWIKAGLLVGLLLFAIFIIQKITTNQGTISQSEISLTPIQTPITDNILFLDYSSDKRTETLEVNYPYQFSIKTSSPVWYQYILDQSPPTLSDLVKGGEIIMDFESTMKLRLNHTQNVDFRINGQPVSLISRNFPIDLAFDSGTGQVDIIQYSPK